MLRELTKGTSCIFCCSCGFFRLVRIVTKIASYLHHGSWVGTPAGGRDLTYASRSPGGLPSLRHKIYRVFFLWVRRPRRGVNHPAHLVLRLQKEYSIPIPLLPMSLQSLSQGDLYLYLYLHHAPPSVRSMG